MKRTVYLFRFILLLILLFIGHVSAQNPKMDSLKNVIATTKSDTTKARTFCRLSLQFNLIGALDSSFAYGNKGLAMAVDQNDDLGQCICGMELGKAYIQTGSYEEAVQKLNIALTFSKKLEQPIIIANISKLLGAVYYHLGNYPQAVFHMQNSLKIFEKKGIKAGIASCFNNLALVYQQQKDFDKALHYYQNAIPLFQQTQSKMYLGNCYNNIGMLYYSKNEFVTALDYYRQSLAIFQEIGDENGIAGCFLNMSNVYNKQHLSQKAIQALEQAILIFDKTKDINGLSISYTNIGTAWGAIGQPAKGIKYALDGYKLAQQCNSLERLKDASEACFNLQNHIGNHQSALEFHILFKQYSDSLINHDKSQEIGRLEAQYEFDKQNEARELAEAQAQARRMQLYYLFGGIFAVVLLLTGFTYYRYRSKAKTNRVLNEKNEQITAQNEQILTQKAELENAYEELNTTLEQIQAQKQDIEQKNHKIEDSIRYAYQIQTAILPDPAILQSILPPHFIFYQPKDIVSGDFYWASVRDNRLFFCVADCTGHGVPGAFMSVVGSNALHHAINELGLNDPDVILHELDRKIKATLRQDKASDSKDGMDIVLCVLEDYTLQYAGAGRPLYLLQNGILIETKGDKFPIGGGQFEEKSFTTHTFSLRKGDRLYLFSDGITDQFGGIHKKKFTPKRLQEFILTHQHLTIHEQGILFQDVMHQWMIGQSQLDDLTLMGIAIA
jgi:serine phosphatase RsbU (regulator of sigma subunit)/Flp pilus assembly protein TadD